MSFWTKEHRVAVALNNMAVALQERSCEKQALETFQDALSLMKIASRAPGTAPTCDVDAMINKAFQSFAKPKPCKGQTCLSFTSLPDDADFSAALKCVSNGCNSLLIRIEEYGSEHSSQRDLDLDCAIMLQNFGLSSLCHSYSVPQSAQKLRNNACQLLQLSHTIISQQASSECNDEDLMQKTFFVALVITKSLAQALFSTTDSEWKVKECMEHLENLKSVIYDLGYMEMTPCMNVAAAA